MKNLSYKIIFYWLYLKFMFCDLLLDYYYHVCCVKGCETI